MKTSLVGRSLTRYTHKALDCSDMDDKRRKRILTLYTTCALTPQWVGRTPDDIKSHASEMLPKLMGGVIKRIRETNEIWHGLGC